MPSETRDVRLAATGEMKDQADSKRAHKQRTEVNQMWATLLRAVCVRRRIQEEYGSPSASGS